MGSEMCIRDRACAISRGYTCDKLGNIYNKHGRMVKPKSQNRNKVEFGVRMNGRMMNVSFSRFIAFFKFGVDEVTKSGIMVKHKDGNVLNNRWDNLVLRTAKQITKEEKKRLLSISRKGMLKANPRTKKEREKIYKMLYDGVSYSKIGKCLGVKKGTLSFMKNLSLIHI